MYRGKSTIAGLRACFYFNTYSIPVTCQFLLVMYIYFRPALTFAFISSIQDDSCLAENIIFRHPCKRMTKGQVFIANQLLMCKVTFYIFTVVTITCFLFCYYRQGTYILIQVLSWPHLLAVSLTLPRLTFQFSMFQIFRIIFLLFIITCRV